jgi:hypothetical protein
MGDGYTHNPKGQRSQSRVSYDNKPTDDMATMHKSIAGAAVQEISEEEYPALIKEEYIEWLVDLGASSHICINRDAFSQLEKLAFPKRFRTASGSATVSEFGGKVTMKSPQDQCDNGRVTLHNVVLMEDVPANLLSQQTLIEKGWNVDITKEGGMISQYGINITVYKTGSGGTLRAFKMPSRKDLFKRSE